MLEIKKLEVERAKVEAAAMEFELKIYQAQEEIKRLEENIKIQRARVLDINENLIRLQGV